MPAALVSGGIHHVGFYGVDGHVYHAGVFADVKHVLPGFAAVGGFIKAAVASRPPKRTFSGDKHNVAVTRVDGDATDVLGLLQAHVRPAFAAIFRAIDAIAITDAALAVALAASHPHHAGIFRIEHYRADGIAAFTIEYRGPGDSVVLGLPDTARGSRDVIMRVIFRINGNGQHASGDHGRADETQLQSLEGARRHGIGRGLFIFLFLLGWLGCRLLRRCRHGLKLGGFLVLRENTGGSDKDNDKADKKRTKRVHGGPPEFARANMYIRIGRALLAFQV